MQHLNQQALASLVDEAIATGRLDQFGHVDLPPRLVAEINDLPLDQARHVLREVDSRVRRRNYPLAAPRYAHALAQRRRLDRLVWTIGVVGVALYVAGKLILYGVGR